MARTARTASSEPGCPGGRSRSCHGTRGSSEAGGSHGWCGSGKDIQQNHGSSAPERGEPVDGQVRHPVGVVPLPRDGVVLRLRRRRVAPRLGLQQPGEAVEMLGVVLLEPAPVVRDRVVAPRGGVHGLLGPLEPAPRSGVAPGHPRVLLELVGGVEAGLEVGLAQEGGAVARGVVQVLRHRGGVDRERDAVGHDAVGPDVLARQHGRARRHAHRVLVVGARVVDRPRRPAGRPRACGPPCRRCSPRLS